MWRKGSLCALQVGMETGTANMENSIWGLHENFKIELPHSSAIARLGTCPKKTKLFIKKKGSTVFFETLFIIAEL